MAAIGGYGEAQGLPVLLSFTVRVSQVGVQSYAAAVTIAPPLVVVVLEGADVVIRGVVRLVVRCVVIDDVNAVKGGLAGQAPPLSF